MEQRLTTVDKKMAEIVHKAPKDDWEIIKGLVLVNHEYELEEEISKFLQAHPRVELNELCNFVWSLCPELVVED